MVLLGTVSRSFLHLVYQWYTTINGIPMVYQNGTTWYTKWYTNGIAWYTKWYNMVYQMVQHGIPNGTTWYTKWYTKWYNMVY
jgi:hypothetical protein